MNKMNEKQEVQKPETPICRLCLQEKDFWGNFAIVYPETGLIQHKYCMARYSQNRRNLKKVIFKVKYQEYFGDTRQAGIVDRKAMELIQGQGDSAEKAKKSRKEEKRALKRRLAYARKCKAEKRIERELAIGKKVKECMEQAKPKPTFNTIYEVGKEEDRTALGTVSALGKTQLREEG